MFSWEIQEIINILYLFFLILQAVFPKKCDFDQKIAPKKRDKRPQRGPFITEKHICTLRLISCWSGARCASFPPVQSTHLGTADGAKLMMPSARSQVDLPFALNLPYSVTNQCRLVPGGSDHGSLQQGGTDAGFQLAALFILDRGGTADEALTALREISTQHKILLPARRPEMWRVPEDSEDTCP